MSIRFASGAEDEALADRFAAAHPLGSFMQSPRWALVKPKWGHTVLLSQREDGVLRGSMLVLTLADRGDGKALLYAPRGPVCAPHDLHALADLFAGARMLASRFGRGEFKCDPLIGEGDAEAVAELTALGLSFAPGAKFRETVQPRQNAVRRGLAGMSEGQLLASFSAKTRYYVRRAAAQGVVCAPCGRQALPEFYALYEETGRRQGFAVRPQAYLEAILQAFGQDARLYLCRSPEDEPLAGSVAVAFGPRLSFVYGASSRIRPELAACYLLQWEMLRFALERGCDLYDMGGICTDEAESPALFQLYTFKKKFAPAESLAGEFGFVF